MDHVATCFAASHVPRVVLCCHVILCLGCRQPGIVIQMIFSCTCRSGTEDFLEGQYEPENHMQLLSGNWNVLDQFLVWGRRCWSIKSQKKDNEILLGFCWILLEFRSVYARIHRILEHGDENTEHQLTRGLHQYVLYIFIYIYYPHTRVRSSVNTVWTREQESSMIVQTAL